MDHKEYIAIIWPRQVGKTTFMKKLKEEYPKSFYYNFEDFTIKWEFEKNPIAFIKGHLMKDDKSVLFFDEFQYVTDAGSILKLIFDTFEDMIKIVITGSSSLHLKEIGAKMVGRMLSFEMQWLTMDEILKYKNTAYFQTKTELAQSFNILHMEIWRDNLLKLRESLFLPQIRQIVDEYIIWGWMPAIVKANSIEEKNMVLSNFTQNYINKDIVNLLKVRNIDKFSSLMTTLSIIIWQQLVIENLSNDLWLNIVTLNEYLNYLNNTFINVLINPYHKNSLNEIRKQKIEYFYDPGIRNYLIKNFNSLDIRSDSWHLMENYIFLRLNLLKESFLSLNYWRDKSGNEVDFVIKMHDNIIPIEIKYQNMKEPEITTGMKKFNELYKDNIPYSMVITKDLLDMFEFNGKSYYFIPYYMI